MQIQIFRTPGVFKLLGCFGCLETLTQDELALFKREMFRAFWHYTNNKIMDLLDTIFFVLTKKQSHVTFLHVHHHSIMVGVLWIIGKYFPGFEGGIVGLCNTIVHTVMYFYYFLAALGPNVRKYLWWKNYLTLMQIVQFLIIISYGLACYLKGCSYKSDLNHYVIGFIIVEALFNLYLFTSFYIKSYSKQHNKTLNNNTTIENKNHKKIQ